MAQKISILIVLSVIYLSSFAQENVTKFLGIPINGTKAEMKAKLKEKGFSQSELGKDWLAGEFNGEDVLINIQTNNNKVWRICVFDENYKSEGQIKIRYNKLCQQFQNNSRYMIADSGIYDYSLSDTEDISYNILVHDKQYQASFFQDKSNSGLLDRRVWFTIGKGITGIDFRILMFYENLKNQANGEDL